MSDFQFDDIFSAPVIKSDKRNTPLKTSRKSMNWGLLLEPSTNLSSPEKKAKMNTASKAMAAINELSGLSSAKEIFSKEESEKIEMYNPESKINKCLNPECLARIGHVSVRVNDKIYIHGGISDSSSQKALGDLLLYDLNTNTVSNLLCESSPRAWHTANFLSDNDLILIFGGERSSSSEDEETTMYIDEPLVLDTSINLWYPPSISGKGPGGRSGHTATHIKDNLIVFLCGRKGGKWCNSVFYLDTSRWHWMIPVIEGKPPKSRAFHTCSKVSNNRIVLFGGSDDFRCFNDIHVLRCDQVIIILFCYFLIFIFLFCKN